MKFGFWSGVSFHPELNLLVWQPRGILDEPHVEQLIDLLEEAEDEAKRPFNRYTDLSTLDAVEITFDYVFRVSLYRRVGPCLAVSLNDRQDYFGQTVNIAARVQGLATSRSIFATAQVVGHSEASKLLQANGIAPTPQRHSLRGITNEFEIFEIP